MAVLEIYLEVLTNFFEILYPPLSSIVKQMLLNVVNFTYNVFSKIVIEKISYFCNSIQISFKLHILITLILGATELRKKTLN